MTFVINNVNRQNHAAKMFYADIEKEIKISFMNIFMTL